MSFRTGQTLTTVHKVLAKEEEEEGGKKRERKRYHIRKTLRTQALCLPIKNKGNTNKALRIAIKEVKTLNVSY